MVQIHKLQRMDVAAENGQLDVLMRLHENPSEKCTKNAMDWAAKNGHLDVIKWLHEIRSEGCTVWAMDWAARNGHLHMVKWLHENTTEGCTTCAMDWAAINGHLDVVMWLHENRSEGCTVDAMDWSARNGHLHVVMWLHENTSGKAGQGCTEWYINCVKPVIARFLVSSYKKYKNSYIRSMTVSNFRHAVHKSVESIGRKWAFVKLKRTIKTAALKYRMKCEIECMPGRGVKYFDYKNDFYSRVATSV